MISNQVFLYHLKLFRFTYHCDYNFGQIRFMFYFCCMKDLRKSSNVLRRPVFCRITSKRMFWHHIHTENKKKSQCRDETLNYCNKTFVNIVRLLPSKVVLWHLKDIDICVVCRSFLSLLYFCGLNQYVQFWDIKLNVYHTYHDSIT